MFGVTGQNLHLMGLVRNAVQRRTGALERLSSSKRINKAADDAAGMAVASGLSSRLQSTDAARRNIQDAMATVQIAEEGVGQIIDSLNRTRTLAMASASGTASDTSRAHMQEEISELLDQIDEVSEGAVYTNENIKLLAGGHIEIAFLVDTSYSMVQEINALRSGITDFEEAITNEGFAVNFALAEYKLPVDAQDGVDTLATLGDPGFIGALNGLSVSYGVVDPYAALLQAAGITAEDSDTGSDAVGFTDEAKERHIIVLTDTRREIDLLDADDSQQAVADMLDDNQITVHVIGDPGYSSRYSAIINETGGSWADLGASGNNVQSALANIAGQITRVASYPAPIRFQIGVDNTDANRITLQLPINATPQGLGIAGLSVATREGALESLDDIDAAIEFLAGQQARFGGWTNRLEHALNLNISQSTGMTAAVSRIEDADMAAESITLAREGILQEAAMMGLKMHREMTRDRVVALLA